MGERAQDEREADIGSAKFDQTKSEYIDEHCLTEINDLQAILSKTPEKCQANILDGAGLKHDNSLLTYGEQTRWDHTIVPSNAATSSSHESSRNVCLILVGLPGSGKSTFCGKILQSQAPKWERICQDVISNGKRGSKEQCLRHAGEALKQDLNVMIDRCNLNRDQRLEFLELARKLHIEVEALVLDLPIKLCIQRAVHRTNHEGGLEGKGAPAAIQRMAQNKELPSTTEGFSSIIRCQTDVDIEKALGLYLQSSGCRDPVTSSIENDYEEQKKKIHMRLNVGDAEKLFSGNEQKERDCERRIKETNGRDLVENPRITPEMRDLESGINRCEQDLSVCSKRMSTDEGVRTLAFPSLSTADFQFDHEKAADIIIEKVSDFLFKYRKCGFRLVFVDLKENSDMLVRVRQRAAKCGLNSAQFSVLAGDITRLRSTCGVCCNFIANATNWRLKPGGGGVNAAIFKAAGEVLEIETKKCAKTLNPGTALVVPLPKASPLRTTEGVTHIIHVLGPNMNPQRPNCLKGDYVEGCKVLRDAYSCLFQSFASTVAPQVSDELCREPTRHCHSKGMTGDTKKETSLDAFTILIQSAKRKHANAGNEQKAKHGRQAADCRLILDPKILMSHDTSSSTSATNDIPDAGCNEGPRKKHGAFENNEHEKSKKWGSWAQVLRDIALHPEQHKDTVLQVTPEAVVITDRYPKGRKHLLVISRTDGLDSIAELRSSHLALVQHMHTLGQMWAESSIDQDHSLVFRMGYHSDPSMRQLHMHVISQDFDSPCLKNKKHWNSFTTTFFRDSKNVIEELKRLGKVKPYGDETTLLKIELRCHRCQSAQPNISRLKQHVLLCQVPFPSDLTQQGYIIRAN